MTSTVADTEKTLKLLKSNNQPLVRKRQLMRTTFGDYRTKMQEEEKKMRLGKHESYASCSDINIYIGFLI